MMTKTFLFRGKRYIVGVSEIPDDVRNDPALSEEVRALLKAEEQSSANDDTQNESSSDTAQDRNAPGKHKPPKKKAEKSATEKSK